MKLAKKLAPMLLAVLVLMQFYRPKKNSSQGDHSAVFLAETNPSKEVMEVFTQTCYNCHSNNTNYPWYNNVAPISFWLARDIKQGKVALNFSEWAGYSPKMKDRKLVTIKQTVDSKKMPLQSYLWAHRRFRLSQSERQAIIAWADQTSVFYQLNRRPE
ncbi:MAG: heme-binding domain-containing protein [Maribacter sp.]|nr:heme-binding domain-containing protein [Maribacter sp.]